MNFALRYLRRLRIDELVFAECGVCRAVIPEAGWAAHAEWHEKLDNEIAEAAGTALAPIERTGQVVGTVCMSDDFEARLIAAVKEACEKAFGVEYSVGVGNIFAAKQRDTHGA